MKPFELDLFETGLREAVPACAEFPAFDPTEFPYAPDRRGSEPTRFNTMYQLYQTMFQATESYVPGLLGVDLAYLYQAILANESIDLHPDTLLARILAREYAAGSEIWAYVSLGLD